MQGTIYLAINKTNGKKYVGQTTKTLKERIRSHWAKRNCVHYGVTAALLKYGKDGFNWIVLENCDVKDLDARETFHIECQKSLVPLGYNLTTGGRTRFGSFGENHFLHRMDEKERDEWLNKHRLGVNNPNYGNGSKIAGKNHFLNKLNQEQREKWLDDNLRGDHNYQKHMSKEDLKKKNHFNQMTTSEKQEWSETHLVGENNPYKKACLKHPEKYRGVNHWAYQKTGSSSPWSKTFIVTFPDGRMFKTKSISGFCEAFNSSNELKILRPGLYRCAKGHIKTYRGFQCRYATDRDEDVPKYDNQILLANE